VTRNRTGRIPDLGIAVSGAALLLGAGALPVPEAARVVAALMAFLVPPLWLWRDDSGDGGLAAGTLHLLVLLLLLSFLPAGLAGGRALWAGSLVVPLVVRRNAPRPGRPAAWMALGALALASWMALTPSPPGIWSDAPAHLAAVHDARTANTWMPPDPSAPDHGTDPRFGVAHGLYAAVAEGAAASPRTVLAFLPVLVAPLWWWGHAILFRRLGAGRTLAWGAAALFTVAGAGGRGFGLWSGAYPGNLALALAAPGLALWIEGTVSGSARRAGWGILAVTLTAAVHPFAWWGATIGVLLTALLLLTRHTTRALGGRALGGGLVSVGVGALWMLPRLLDRGSSTGGLHDQITDAVLVGPGFAADPYWLMRWGGPHVLWAFLVALLVPAAWTRRTAFAFGFAAMPWLLALNPLVFPLVWEVGGYLSTRLVRYSYVALVAVLVAPAALARVRGSGRGSRWTAAAGGLLAVWLLGTQVGAGWAVLRNPPRAEPGVWDGVEAVADTLHTLPPGRFLADPRTSYALRAVGAPPAAVVPVAHASPRDADLARRLRGLRSLLDPTLPADSLRVILGGLDAGVLLLDPDADARYPRADFGFVYDGARVRALRARLDAAGIPRREVGGMSLHPVGAILETPPRAEPAPSAPPPGRDLDGPVGASLRILDVRIQPERARPGDTVTVEVWMEPRLPYGPSPHPEWQQVSLRFEGPMLRAPEWAAPVGKLVRKLLLERSRRSPARFHRSWFPFDAVHAPARWAGVVRETRSLRIPPWAVPGTYTLQPSVREAPWRTRIPWTDYLRDGDSLSGPAVGTLLVEGTR